MENKLVTLAIHRVVKAHVLKNVLEANGIQVFFEEIGSELKKKDGSNGILVKIREVDLPRALSIIEEKNLYDYRNESIVMLDDGRKRILVPVDFSDHSINACNFAFKIAKQTDAKVKILHVFNNMYFPSHIPFADSMKDENDENMLDKARKMILNLCYEIDNKITAGELPSINYSYSLREGIAEEEIEKFIDEYKPSLIVMGSKGIDHESSGLIGSVVSEIIEMTDIPVLAIPEDAYFKDVNKLKHIAVLTNFQHQDLLSFEALSSTLPFPDLKITLVHINLINKRNEYWTDAQIKEKSNFFRTHYPHMNINYRLIDTSHILQGINELLKEDVDILVLNTRKRNLFGRIFRPSVANEILLNTNAVILILRN